MTQKEILKGNKLIAEFMGLYSYGVLNPVYAYNDDDYLACNHYELKELIYHSSWDWLMPVVEKIGNIPEHGYVFKRSLDGGLFYKIESVWLAVVEFIKWYNQNDKPK
jgi:hypothetical protein